MNKIWVCIVLLIIILIGLIVPAFFIEAHTYDRVIMNMPDGTIVGAENVRIRDQDESWKIICEDGSVYIIEKKNCVIFD
jgi:hypothetical protein